MVQTPDRSDGDAKNCMDTCYSFGNDIKISDGIFSGTFKKKIDRDKLKTTKKIDPFRVSIDNRQCFILPAKIHHTLSSKPSWFVEETFSCMPSSFLQLRTLSNRAHRSE